MLKNGVLQGDSLSRLFFNMYFNILIRTVENKKKLMGCNYTNALTPRHWFQFTDDTALATATQRC